MSKLSFRLPIPAISINAMYARNRQYKTKQYGEWENHFFYHYSKHADSVKAFRALFDPKLHCFKLSLTFGIHTQSFYTKAGTISNHSMDLSNCEKPILDCLMLSKFEGRSGAAVLGIDDKYVTSLISTKVPASAFYIDVEFEIISKPILTV